MNEMRRKPLHICLAAVLVLSLCSCSKELSGPYGDISTTLDTSNPVIDKYIAVTDLLTVKRSETGDAYFQFGAVKLWPDIEVSFDLPQRALASMVITPNRLGDYYKCMVDWLEPLENGVFNPSPDYSSSAPGKPEDGLDLLLDSALTRLEDGFLSLHYNAWWGEHAVHHDFSLTCTGSSDGVYDLSLVQDSHGDSKDFQSEGVICFDISSLSEISAGHKTIVLNWIKLDGTEGTASFELE